MSFASFARLDGADCQFKLEEPCLEKYQGKDKASNRTGLALGNFPCTALLCRPRLRMANLFTNLPQQDCGKEGLETTKAIFNVLACKLIF